MNEMRPVFTEKQGQYLAFIYYYTKVNGRAPAEDDIQRYFRVSAPSIHAMIKTLHEKKLIARLPGQARSITVQVSRSHLPDLE